MYELKRKLNSSHTISLHTFAFTGTFTFHEDKIASRGYDVLINCAVDFSVEQNNTIAWANVLYFSGMLISESLKYTMNTTELLIHNLTVEDEGEYACYSEELAIVYAVIDIIVTCKCFLVALFTLLVTILYFRESRIDIRPKSNNSSQCQ